jgi:hypothetical protein
MKVLVLVTLSYDQSIYSAHRDVWREFMHTHPDVTSYFIASRDGVQSVIEDGDILWTPGPEGYPNGVPSGARLEKTLDALEWAEGRGFDFVVRTGLSSLWIYANLLTFLSSLPRTGVYCGIDGGGFISGAGTILSADVASLLVRNRDLAVSFPSEEDVRMGACMEALGIPRRPATRVDVLSPEHYRTLLIPTTAYHFRVKFHIHDQDIRKQEVAVMRDILQRYKIFFQR